MFISPAFAQVFGGGSQDTLTTFVLPMALIFVVFYFFMIRPQQQKQKQLKSMLDSLRRGDRIVTGGGIIGTVVKVENDQEVTVEIADNVRVRVLRSTVVSVLTKPEPVTAKKGDADEKGADSSGKKSGTASAKKPELVSAGAAGLDRIKGWLKR